MEKGMLKELSDAVERKGLVNAVYEFFGIRARINLKFTEKVCNALIEELDLSVRGYNVLKRNGMNTVGEVIDAINEKRMISLRNLGEKTLREIKTKIVNFGYTAMSEGEKKTFLSEVIRMNAG